MGKYKAVIGLEMHCELKSNSKVFSSGKNSYSEIANSNVSPVDMAFPGTLPVANKKCVRDAIKMAMDIRPELLSAEKSTNAAKMNLRATRREFAPDLDRKSVV